MRERTACEAPVFPLSGQSFGTKRIMTPGKSHTSFFPPGYLFDCIRNYSGFLLALLLHLDH
jgi:hypothetical protein